MFKSAAAKRLGEGEKKGKMKEGAGRTVIGTREFVFVLYRSLKGVLVVEREIIM